MDRTWMLVFIIFLSSNLLANDATDATTSPYYNSGFSTRKPPVEEVVQDEIVAVPPVTGEVTRRPGGLVIEDADPEITIEGFDPDLDYNRTEDARGPAVGPFKKLFERCAPAGCTGGQVIVCRAAGCRHNHGSCHNSGEAVDLMSMRCDGRRHTPYTVVDGIAGKKYMDFVACARRTEIEAPGRQGRLWKALFREGEAQRGGCGGVGLSTPRLSDPATQCHWNHVHFSMHCRRGGGWSY